ncbi:MAG: hypothetical protein J6B32_04930 [Spirochaetaceae bacterium]|nr:hypothetical protein [Spirochaetaceae bacterium]
MANDNKIKLGKAEVKLFLSNEMLPSENDKPILYDLEAEYAKSKKAKSFFTIWVLLACIVVVVLLTFAVTKYIEYKNNHLSVGIQVFEDLNLKNLLDVVSRTEESMQEVTKKKIQLEAEKQALVLQAEVKKQGDLELLDSLRLSSSERKKREQTINQEYEQEIQSISGKYDSQIDFCSLQIEELQVQLSSYDKKNVEMAQQQEAALNSQLQVFQLEKAEMEAQHQEKITDLQNQMATMQQQMVESRNASLNALTVQYESEIEKLDPVLDYPIANQIISDVANFNTMMFDPSQFKLNISDEATVAQAQNFLGKIGKDFENFNYIGNLFQSVNWHNSLKDYSKTVINLANSIGIETVNAAIELLQSQEARFQQEKESYAHEKTSALQQSNAEYEKIYSAFETMALNNNHMGYILDLSDSSCMLTYVIDSLKNKVQEGTRASVVDSQGNIVGQGNLLAKGGFIYIVPDFPEQAALMQPMYELQIDSSTLKEEVLVSEEKESVGENFEEKETAPSDIETDSTDLDESVLEETVETDESQIINETLENSDTQQTPTMDSNLETTSMETEEVSNSPEGVLHFSTEIVN